MSIASSPANGSSSGSGSRSARRLDSAGPACITLTPRSPVHSRFGLQHRMCEKGCPTMDQERFDALSRALASARHRRGVLGLVLGATLFAHGSSVFAEPGKAKGKGHGKDGGDGHAKGKGKGHGSDKACAELACETIVPENQKPEFCCKGGFCSCGGRCCEGHCFQIGDDVLNPEEAFCCTGPKLFDCGGNICVEGSREDCAAPGPSLIAGSYR